MLYLSYYKYDKYRKGEIHIENSIKWKVYQIIERIANANGTSPEAMRNQMDTALENILRDTSGPHGFMLNDLFPDGKPTTDEFVVALEQELYDSMMPKYEGWEWDGAGYRNIALLGRLQNK